MKKIIFLSLSILISVSALARTAKVGIKGGLYFSTLYEIGDDINNAALIALKESNTGYHIGLVGSFVFPGFFMQPELLFTGTGHYMQLQSEGISEPESFFEQKFQHLSMPLLLGMKLGPVKLGAGPVFSVLLNQVNDYELRDIKMKIKDATLGYQLGIGLQIGSLLLEGRYESSLSKYGEGVSIGGETFNFDMRPKQMILSVGLLF